MSIKRFGGGCLLPQATDSTSSPICYFIYSLIASKLLSTFNACISMLSALRGRAAASTMKLDPAVVNLLSLDPEKSSVSSHGGGGMSSASTLKINTTLSDGTEKSFFMKTGKGSDAEIMFEGSPFHSRLFTHY
jgi:hypothetical protein